jgi:hypothetical protein
MTSTAADPLPSWNDGPAKQGIIAFIAKVTKEGSPDFLPLAERIAVYDNDGTLWPENPMPFQAAPRPVMACCKWPRVEAASSFFLNHGIT